MGKAKAASAIFDLISGGARKGVRHMDEAIESAARSGKYMPYEIELARANPGYNPRKAWQGGGNEPILFGQTGNATPKGQFGEAVRQAQTNAFNRPNLDSTLIDPYKPNLRPNTENYLGNRVDPSAREWYTPGGGHDQALAAILEIKRGKFKGTYTIEQLIELHRNAKSSGDKTFLKGKIDEYESMLATGPAKDAEDIIMYKGEQGLPEARTAILKDEPGYVAQYDKSLEFHHKSMKRLEGVIWRKAKEFLSKGDADVDDLANLHKQSQVMGVESGSRGDAAVFMHRPVHNEFLHKAQMVPMGIEPKTHKWKQTKLRGTPANIDKVTWDKWKADIKKAGAEFTDDINYIITYAKTIGLKKAIAKWKKRGPIVPDGLSEMDRWVKEIENVKSFEELIAVRQDMLEMIAQPMTREAELLEQTIEPWTAREIQGLRDSPNPVQTIRQARDAQEFKNFDLREAQIDEAIRQGRKPPEPLPDPEYADQPGDYV